MAKGMDRYGRGALSAKGAPSNLILTPEQIAAWNISRLNFTYPQEMVRAGLAKYRTTVLFGGNFSAKTFINVESCVECCLGGFPWARPPVNVMLLGLAAEEAREAFQEYIELFVPPDMVIRSTTREELTKVVRFKNGSKLVTRTAGQGRENLQGSRLHMVGIDEEPPWSVFKELRMRLRADAQMRILITMTPLKGYSLVYKNLVQRKEELGVRVIQAAIFENGTAPCQTCGLNRQEYAERLGGMDKVGTPLAWALCHRCRGYGVEPRVSQVEVDEIEALYQDVPAELSARLYGTWSDLMSNKVLTADDVAMLESKIKEPTILDDGTKVWSLPQPGKQYVVGVDTGGGRGYDETVIDVYEAYSGEQVAQWCDKDTPEFMAATQVRDLVKDYNNAMVWVEIPGPGYALLEALKALGTFRYYEQRRYDRAHREVVDQRIGWHSSVRGRDMILRNLLMALRTGELTIRDAETVAQLKMLSEDGRTHKLEVPEHYHDDRIFGAAGAHECRLTYYFGRATKGPVQSALQKWMTERYSLAQDRKQKKIHPYMFSD